MTNKELLSLQMHQTVAAHLQSGLAVYTKDSALVTLINDYNLKLQEVESLAPGLLNRRAMGVEYKRFLRTELADLFANTCGYALVAFKKYAMTIAAGTMYVNRTDYTQIHETTMLSRMQFVINNLTEHRKMLIPDYLGEDDIKELTEKLAAFSNVKQNIEVANRIGPNFRQSFKYGLQELGYLLNDIKLLARKYAKSAPKFVDGIHYKSKIVDTGIRHTRLELTLLHKADQTPIPEANISFNRTSKTYTSDENGKVKIDRMQFGKNTLFIKTKEKPDYKQVISIKQGKENFITVQV